MGLSERERRAIPPASNAKHGGASDLRGARIAGRYVLGDLLGKGGMGSVYRAADESSGGEVALKLLARTDENPRMAALFEREYHTLAGLRHPSIIEVHDYGVSEHGAYYTMELLDGRDLRDLAPLPYKDACRHLRDVASSLALLHSRRLIHRDLSPRNVRLTKGGRGKLIDFGALSTFGLAKEIVGTPLCVAPEAMYTRFLRKRCRNSRSVGGIRRFPPPPSSTESPRSSTPW
jgi:serine/threonine protein kinase